MQEISTAGFERRISTEFPTLSRSQVKRAAKKIAWRSENMQIVEDFYESLRILGLISDTTARDAIRNLAAAA